MNNKIIISILILTILFSGCVDNKQYINNVETISTPILKSDNSTIISNYTILQQNCKDEHNSTLKLEFDTWGDNLNPKPSSIEQRKPVFSKAHQEDVICKNEYDYTTKNYEILNNVYTPFVINERLSVVKYFIEQHNIWYTEINRDMNLSLEPSIVP